MTLRTRPLHPLFGAEADLQKLTVSDCRAWYKERFGPGRALLTVTGRFDPAEARAAIEATWRTLGTVAARGSEVVFDFIHPDALSGPAARKRLARAREDASMGGVVPRRR